MIQNNQKTSLLIPGQLPSFIRDDPSYSNFVLFLQAYYEWMEQEGNVTDVSKNLLNYKDIDHTTDQFLDYFWNDFMSYFPQDILADKKKAIKLAKELYQAKGTPSAYKFLFKTLYNTDVDFFYTKDVVLKASAGKWYVARSLKLASDNVDFLETNNLRLFGETTKSIATIENSILVRGKIEVFISDIQRLFESGEYVRVVDTNNQDVLFGGQPLRAKIVGQISQIKINPNNRGLLYEVGDPVIVYGGLNSEDGYRATASISETTTGSIQRIAVDAGGYGYRLNPNSLINITNAPGATAYVAGVNPSANTTANVELLPIDYISLKRFVEIGNSNYNFSNVAVSNANTTLANAFNFVSFQTYPISSVLVTNGGGGISRTPVITAQSVYTLENNLGQGDLKSIGILAPIKIISGGSGYQVNDIIKFTGGTGYGAYANVTTVNSTGAITNVSYVHSQTDKYYPLGGMGYRTTNLPTLSVISSNVQATNAVLTVTSVLGDSAVMSPIVDRVGAVTTINISDPGEDYVATPNVSLKVMDIVVANVSVSKLPVRGHICYQGDAGPQEASFYSYFDSITLLSPAAEPENSLYNLRVYNYTSKPNPDLLLHFEQADEFYEGNFDPLEELYHPALTMANFAYDDNYDVTGVRIYGDGTAKAAATFMNGLVISQGQYLDTTGQPSGHDKLQSTVYNNYTYRITLEKEIEKYRTVLLDLLHPTGMQVIGRYATTTQAHSNYDSQAATNKARPLGFYTGNYGSFATIVSDWNNPSNNIITFGGLSGANLENIIFSNSAIRMTTSAGDHLFSQVVSVTGGDANTVIIRDNVWLTFANVAYVLANSGSNTINITTITNSYNLVNGGVYSNTSYPLMDIVRSGDKILIANNTERIVSSVDYENNIITVSQSVTNNSNSLMSVNRTFTTNDIQIFGPLGTQYFPEITDELGNSITTEDGRIILLG